MRYAQINDILRSAEKIMKLAEAARQQCVVSLPTDQRAMHCRYCGMPTVVTPEKCCDKCREIADHCRATPKLVGEILAEIQREEKPNAVCG